MAPRVPTPARPNIVVSGGTMTEATKNRCEWHMRVPVCETLAGARIHFAGMSIKEQWDLCYVIAVADPDRAPRQLRREALKRRSRRRAGQA